MAYGLDESLIRYITDARGKPEFVVVPVAMWSAAYGQWVSTKRAETARIEATARPGMFRTSMSGYAHMPEPASNPPAFGDRRGQQWAALLAGMPGSEPAPESNSEAREPTTIAQSGPGPAPVIEQPEAPANAQKTRVLAQTFYPREFEETPPDAILEAIKSGVYFLRAWRLHSGLSLHEAAELMGLSSTGLSWHENGYTRPSRGTLTRYAELMGCPLAQLTAKPGSNTQPWLAVIEGGSEAGKSEIAAKPERVKTEPRAPDDTDYPDVVLAHMIAGKSPLTAWRLYCRKTLAQLAEAYGCSPKNIRHLEESATLRPATIAKLCPILHCKPDQLLRPASLEVPAEPLRVREASAVAQIARQRRSSGEARTA